MKNNRKGQTQLNAITGFVLLLVVSGIVLTIGVHVTDEIRTTVSTESTITDETLTLVLNTPVSMGANDIISITTAENVSNVSNVLVRDSNYTLNPFVGTITLLTSDAAGDWNFTYTFYNNTASSDAANGSVVALGDIADWFGIIVVVVIAVIIIGLVIAAFSNRRR
jgi:hypothetical protein